MTGCFRVLLDRNSGLVVLGQTIWRRLRDRGCGTDQVPSYIETVEAAPYRHGNGDGALGYCSEGDDEERTSLA